MTTASLQALLNGLVDYAGLFPPAKLDMPSAVKAFARHRAGPHAAGLARFVCPVSRLAEFSDAAAAHLASLPPGIDQPPEDPWAISVLIDGKLEQNLEAIEAFNRAHEQSDGHAHKHAYSAVVDTVEIKVTTPDIIEFAVESLPEELYPFFEVPTDADFRGFAAALAGTGAGAKIRTGGVTPELFPPADRVADFLLAFNAAEVPFKATAGLHHPLRAAHPLTYEPASPTHTMHGFVNVFLAAALVREKSIPREAALAVLAESAPAAFRFTDAGVSVAAGGRTWSLTTDELAGARENFAICFGSCSFDDPIADLGKLGWL